MRFVDQGKNKITSALKLLLPSSRKHHNAFSWTLILLSTLPLVWAVPAQKKAATANPSVIIPKPQATIIGSTDLNKIDKFNGIPFALPPIAHLRLKRPQPIQTSIGTIKATSTVKSCPQFLFSTDKKDMPRSIIATLTSIPIF